MGTSLIGLLPQNTYSGLIKVGNNTALNTTLKTLSDGAGNDLPMQASTTAINFTGAVSGVASGVSGAIQFSNGSAFASDAANLFWDDTNNRLGVGTNAPTQTLDVNGVSNFRDTVRIGVSGRGGSVTWGGGFFMLNSSGTDGSSLAISDTKIVNVIPGSLNTMINTTTDLGAKLGIRGSGSTSATTSLLVQNSSGTAALQVRDDGYIAIFTGRIFNGSNNDKAMYFEDNIFVASNYQSVSLRVYDGTGYNSGLEVVGSGSESRVGIGTTSPNASAKLQVDSTTKGFLPPRMTTTQKNAIATPAEGLQMYDSTAKSPAYYDGTNWGYTGGALQNAAGNSGTLNISFAAGNIVNLTLNANTTLAFSNAVIGTYIIQVTQGATGSNLLTYPASVKWAGGTAPTLTTTVGKTDILTFYYDGTFYYGNYSLNY